MVVYYCLNCNFERIYSDLIACSNKCNCTENSPLYYARFTNEEWIAFGEEVKKDGIINFLKSKNLSPLASCWITKTNLLENK